MNGSDLPSEVINLSEPLDLDRRLGSSTLALVFAIILFLCSKAFDPSDPQQNEHRIAFWILAGVLLVAAPFSPLHSAKQVDVGRREVTETLFYGRLPLRRRRWPLMSFAYVVLRHTAHEGEGSTVYTADIGLKPADGSRVLWVRSFPATEAGIPAKAHALAGRLRDWTGLPEGPGTTPGGCRGRQRERSGEPPHGRLPGEHV
jgi:hypothetical protein